MKKTFLTLIIIIVGYRAFPQNFSPTSSINNTGAANNFWGGYTFAYATSGSPWNGAFMSFGGFPANDYDCQISTDYGPHGGNHISFRTRNGDAGTWNNWYEIWHSGNLNNSNTDFTAKNIYAGGNIGIGTTQPDQKLTVVGTIHSSEVKVDNNMPPPDYVFEKTYKPIDLTTLKAYLDKNHHLPEIPSAAEMIKNGLNLGEMNLRLLKKVEELTLYIIDKDKQLAEQNIKLSDQQQSIKSQQAQIDELREQLKSITKFHSPIGRRR